VVTYWHSSCSLELRQLQAARPKHSIQGDTVRTAGMIAIDGTGIEIETIDIETIVTAAMVTVTRQRASRVIVLGYQLAPLMRSAVRVITHSGHTIGKTVLMATTHRTETEVNTSRSSAMRLHRVTVKAINVTAGTIAGVITVGGEMAAGHGR
jgi:hypothetical protein